MPACSAVHNAFSKGDCCSSSGDEAGAPRARDIQPLCRDLGSRETNLYPINGGADALSSHFNTMNNGYLLSIGVLHNDTVMVIRRALEPSLHTYTALDQYGGPAMTGAELEDKTGSRRLSSETGLSSRHATPQSTAYFTNPLNIDAGKFYACTVSAGVISNPYSADADVTMNGATIGQYSVACLRSAFQNEDLNTIKKVMAKVTEIEQADPAVSKGYSQSDVYFWPALTGQAYSAFAGPRVAWQTALFQQAAASA